MVAVSGGGGGGIQISPPVELMYEHMGGEQECSNCVGGLKYN